MSIVFKPSFINVAFFFSFLVVLGGRVNPVSVALWILEVDLEMLCETCGKLNRRISEGP